MNQFKPVKVIILFLLTLTLNAQSIVLPSGGEFINEYGGISYSVGQILYTEYSTINEGIQIPYIENTLSINNNTYRNITVYPNPINNVLNIKITPLVENTSYIIYDFLGRILSKDIIKNEHTIIPINYNYSKILLSIVIDNKHIKNYIILKK